MTVQVLGIPVSGMDCAECTLHVQPASAGLPGVQHVDVFLASEKALVRCDLQQMDWMLVPAVLRIARRTMGVAKVNIAFTIGYNAIGLTLAAFGILPPFLAAAVQSLPNVGILANSSRLIRQK